jgi:hypothetical protein
VEIHPVNQPGVDRPRQRVIKDRTLSICHWEAIVQAWAAGDDRAMDDA